MNQRPDPDVCFTRLSSTVPEFDEGLLIATYLTAAPEGWCVANSWHDRGGMITVVLRKIRDDAGHYDL